MNNMMFQKLLPSSDKIRKGIEALSVGPLD
jgi:hypothetical protein